jgi:hypothetical protein
MTAIVESLEDFFPTYLKRLQTKDIEGLGALYSEGASLSSNRGPAGAFWVVGRDAIKEYLCKMLRIYDVVSETPVRAAYQIRNDTVAWRHGVFDAVFEEKHEGPVHKVSVEAFEVLILSPAEGWQYLVDQSCDVQVTTPLVHAA